MTAVNFTFTQSGNFPCLMAPAGPWELALCSWRWDLFFARKREFFFGYFFGVFLVFLLFFGGVFVLFLFLFCFSRVSAKFFLVFFPRGCEQNREFPLCVHTPHNPRPSISNKKVLTFH